MKIQKRWRQANGKYKCPYCNKEYSKSGIGTHIWRNHGKGKKHNPNIGFENGSRSIWNKGLTKETDERLQRSSESLKKTLKRIGGTFKGKKHSVKTKKLIGEKLPLNNKGGRCKWFTIKNPNGNEFKLQGTWEVRFSSVLNLLDKKWIKLGVGNKNHSFKWINDDGQEHTYTPDFWSPKLKKYFEVKGYWWGEDKRKMELVLEQNNINVEIIRKEQLLLYENLLK